MIATARTSVFLSACILAAATTMLIETDAFTTSSTVTTRGLFHPASTTTTTTSTTARRRTATASRFHTSLFGKKKKKSAAPAASAKIQVKLLQHIAGTGQAGDVILVNPIFFDNKLRPQKLARVITDEEVQKDLEKKQSKSDELMKQARAVKDLIDEESEASYVLEFKDNQTGPDGKKLFGGIGPKKLMESLRNDCKEFDAYSKQFTKQVSILDIEEQETIVEEGGGEESEGKYKDYSSSSYSGDSNDSGEESTVKYSSLPKKDKMTIKHTGVFRLKVALKKDLFAKVKVIVD
jgi:ribosomal protein L9